MADFTVRRATEADIPGVFAFCDKYHSDNPKMLDRQRWKWEYNSHVDVSENPAYFIIDSGGSVEGTLGYIPLTFMVDGQRVKGVYPVDYHVNPKFKGLPALRLMKANMALRPITIESNYSRDAERLLNGLKFAEIGSSISDYFLPLSDAGRSGDQDSTTEKVIRNAKSLYRLLVQTSAQSFSKIATRSLRVEINDSFDEGTVPEKQSIAKETYIEKSAGHVRWWYADRPDFSLVYFSIIDHESPQALVICHIDSLADSVTIVDFLSRAPSKAIGSLAISAVINFAIQNNVSSVSTACADRSLGPVLRAFGFSRSMSSLGLRAYCSDQTIMARLSEPEHWRFYIGDSDAI